MSCGHCGSVLVAGAKFCSECGSPAAPVCSGCGTTLPAAARFCAECGRSVERPGGDHLTAAAAHGAGMRTERRITSVLFADLVGFTPLSEARDPEDVRELLSVYFETARQIVDRYGGTIEKYIGDAVMAVWGVPTAHEDDAERAVRAGLDLVDAVASFGRSAGAPGLAMRVGVVTGEVAVTVGAANEGMVVGDAVNTASRVQGRAAPGSVWVDAQTRNLAAASIDFTDAGVHELKGKTEPLSLFAAAAVRGGVAGYRSSDRVQAPLVGRRAELNVVKEMFHVAAEDDRPRVVVLSGEAGVGKSRLAWELRNYLDGLASRVLWHSGRCPSYGEGLAFAALTSAVRDRVGVLPDDSDTEVRDRLTRSLETYVPDPDERVWLRPALETLLGLEDETAGAREELFSAWITWFERLHETSGAAIVWVIDDAHLADDGLLDFVERLAMVTRAPVFSVMTARPELLVRRPWLASLRRATVVGLAPLTRTESAELVRLLVEGVPDDVLDELVTRTEGNPLYALETVRALHDHGLTAEGPTRTPGAVRIAPGVDGRRLRELAAPASLQILVNSRLDLLAEPERAVLAAASVLGQTCTATAVATLVSDGLDTDASLRELVSRDLLTIVDDRRPAPERRYAFVQTVVRQIAYRTQSRRDRLARHLAVAAHFEPQADADHDLCAVIAQHLRDALGLSGRRDSAAGAELRQRLRGWLERSARRAEAVGAPAEAVRAYLEAGELAGEPGELVRLRLAAAEAASAAGMHEQVIELATTVLADEDTPTRADRAQSAALASIACRRRGHYRQGWTFVEPYTTNDLMPGLPPLVTSRLTREIGAFYAETGRLDLAWEWQERSVNLAEDTGDAREIVRSTNNFAITAGNRGHARIAIALFELCADLCRRSHLVAEYALSLDNLIAYLMNRDLEAALAAGAESLQVGESAGDSTGCWHTAANRLMLLTLAGRWDGWAEVVDRPLLRERPAEPDQAAIHSLFAAVVAEARGEPVDLDTLRRVGGWADELPESTGTSFYLANRAMHARLTGDREAMAVAARSAVETSARYCGLDDDFPHLWTLATDWLLDASDFDAVRDVLRPVLDTPPTRWSPLLAAQVPRVRGALEALDPSSVREPAEVERDLQDAVAALSAFGAVADRARAQATLGVWLRQRHREGEAVPVLAAAAETFTALGAQAWLRGIKDGVPAPSGADTARAPRAGSA